MGIASCGAPAKDDRSPLSEAGRLFVAAGDETLQKSTGRRNLGGAGRKEHETRAAAHIFGRLLLFPLPAPTNFFSPPYPD